jgi:hypothetical protein
MAAVYAAQSDDRRLDPAWESVHLRFSWRVKTSLGFQAKVLAWLASFGAILREGLLCPIPLIFGCIPRCCCCIPAKWCNSSRRQLSRSYPDVGNDCWYYCRPHRGSYPTERDDEIKDIDVSSLPWEPTVCQPTMTNIYFLLLGLVDVCLLLPSLVVAVCSGVLVVGRSMCGGCRTTFPHGFLSRYAFVLFLLWRLWLWSLNPLEA